MSERESFEARAAQKLRLPVEIIRSARNGDGYLHAFDSMSVMQPLNGWWEWWQASREALKDGQVGDGWIACAHRMPERGGQYCVWNGSHVGLVTYLFGSFQCLAPEKITHWQNHPSPPSHQPIDTTSQQYESLSKGESQ